MEVMVNLDDSLNKQREPKNVPTAFALTSSLDQRIRTVKTLLEAEFRKPAFNDSVFAAIESVTAAWEKKLGIK